MPIRSTPHAPAQRGFILITGMLFLVVMTLVALAMFRSTGLMDRISANARDKQRAFESAQSALQYAEWWLSNNSPKAAATPCNGMISADLVTNIHVCSNALQPDYLTAATWSNGFTYTPPNLTAPTGTFAGGTVTSTDPTSDVNYYHLPGFYLEYLGTSASKGGYVYRVTAYGFGGDTNTLSIVRSTYWIPKTIPGGSGNSGLGGA